jgi:hypothetical protein
MCLVSFFIILCVITRVAMYLVIFWSFYVGSHVFSYPLMWNHMGNHVIGYFLITFLLNSI